jgi:hypothetical protein
MQTRISIQRKAPIPYSLVQGNQLTERSVNMEQQVTTKQQTAQDVDWYQLVVADKSGLAGTSVVEFVAPIIRRMGASAVLISDLVGAVSDLKKCEGRVLTPADFLQKAANATQFDWAFLFLYVRVVEAGQINISDDKKNMLEAELTIRLADDTYFYVYGRDATLMNDLRRSYPQAEFKVSKFSSLDVPY